MATYNLTIDRLREVLDYDPETGFFTWREDRGSRKFKGKVAGGIISRGYWLIRIDAIKYLAHRLAWAHVHGKWPDFQVDHINGIKHDNRLCNLRDIPEKMNHQNQVKAMPSNKTGLLGAHMNGYGTFRSTIRLSDGTYLYLGTFKTAQEAHEAYVKAKRIHHAGCTI